MSWRATDLSENDAKRQASDLNVTFNQYRHRDQANLLEVKPPIEVDAATWSDAGKLDYWVRRDMSGGDACVVQTDITCGSRTDFVRLMLRSVVVGQQDRCYRTVGLGDDPYPVLGTCVVSAVTNQVARYEPEAFP